MAKPATTEHFAEFPQDEILDDNYSDALRRDLRTPQATLVKATITEAFNYAVNGTEPPFKWKIGRVIKTQL